MSRLKQIEINNMVDKILEDGIDADFLLQERKAKQGFDVTKVMDKMGIGPSKEEVRAAYREIKRKRPVPERLAHTALYGYGILTPSPLPLPATTIALGAALGKTMYGKRKARRLALYNKIPGYKRLNRGIKKIRNKIYER